MLDSAIAKLGQEKIFKKDVLIFTAGQTADSFYYVLSGEVRGYKMDMSGNEVEIARFGVGDFLGEVILFASAVYPINCITVKPTKLLFFSKQVIQSAINRDPSIAKYFLQLLANKCLVLSKRIELLGLSSVRQRLIQYILKQCPHDGSCTVVLPQSKTDIAAQLGTISATLSRNFSQMQKEGLIKVSGKKIIIRKCAELKSVIT